jgi:hypothetical protein
MPAGLHPAESLNHFAPDLGIPPDSIRSGSALAAVWAAKRDAQFVEVVRRHLRYPAHFRT